MRRWRLGALIAGVAAALTVAAPGSAAFSHTPATDAVVQSLGNGRAALTLLPADFAQVMGYTPELAELSDGSVRVVNPSGSCSVPGEGHPFDFDTACKAHDFGYDLLRYAERTRDPLEPSAREHIDALLTRDLHAQCGYDSSPATCDATVAVFQAGVAFNSWRQLSGPPIGQAGLTRTAGLVLLAGLGSAGFVKVGRTRFRRLRVPGSLPAATAG